MSYHELTQKLKLELCKTDYGMSVGPFENKKADQFEKVVKAWLEKKALELKAHRELPTTFNIVRITNGKLRQILGLATQEHVVQSKEKEEIEFGGYCPDCIQNRNGCDKHRKLKKEATMEQKTWCEHPKSTLGTLDNWKFCPICGAKRPEPEKKGLWRLFQEYSEKNGWFQPVMASMNNSFRLFESLSEIAIEAVMETVDSVSFDHLFDEKSKKEKIKAAIKELGGK